MDTVGEGLTPPTKNKRVLAIDNSCRVQFTNTAETHHTTA